MKNLIAIIMTIIIAISTFAICKADTVEPFEEILDLIDAKYEYVATTGDRNKYGDTVIIAVDMNTIIITEKGSRTNDGYVFNTYDDFAAATIAIITYIAANNNADMYVSFGEEDMSEIESIGQAITLQTILFQYKDKTGNI